MSVEGLIIDAATVLIADLTDEQIAEGSMVLLSEERRRTNEALSVETLAELEALRDIGNPDVSPSVLPLSNVTDTEVVIHADELDGMWCVLEFPKVLNTTGFEQKFWGGVLIWANESGAVPSAQQLAPDRIRCSAAGPDGGVSVKGDAYTVMKRVDDYLDQ